MEIAKTYIQFKQETDLAVSKIKTGAMTMAQGAVELGYQLKLARDTGILQESGYSSMAEFAREEYQIRPDQASRYIQINDKYSVDGYSNQLKGKYAGIGVSLLVDMLQLPDAVRDEITASFSREDIRSLAGEIKEENAVTDLEVMMEEKDAAQEKLPGLLERAAYQLGKDDPELYAELFDAIYEENTESVIESLVPDEEKIYSLRIPGTGRLLLSLKTEEENEPVKLINVRSQEKEGYTWQQLEEALRRTMHFENGPIESWEKQYTDTFPQKETGKEVEKEPERKVKKAKQPKKTPPKETKEVAPVQPEEQIPGQDNILNHPEYAPAAEFEPAPETMTSICYSCGHWNECHEKSNTVTECNEFQNKNNKTPEQKYEEEQERIDRETQRKLKEQEEAMLPAKPERPVRQLRISSATYEEIASGTRAFDIQKNEKKFCPGDRIEYMEFKEGRNTGRILSVEVTYVLEEHSCLEDGYCILSVKVVDADE